ncbi:MAG: FG-GAP-like repeat-containing protein [Flavobacteriales bacterium]|nr:FG-GAP-like repeat-containing protein [Flavobacteriales bacterium]
MKTFTKKLSVLSIGLIAGAATAQISFTDGNSLLHSETGVLGSNANIFSGNAVCVVDVNFDGYDDIVKLDNGRYVRIEYQQSGGTFTHQYIGDFGTMTSCWGMSAADVDKNGYADILFNGGSQARLMKLNNTGTGILGSIINLPNGNIFSQNGNFCDANNDGWLDIFMCNDVDESRLWLNDGTGNFPTENNNTYINFDLTPGTGPGPALSGGPPNHQYDESGNYSSIWTDIDDDGDVDLYIVHCRQGANPGDLRRTNVLFRNNGNGTYTGINQSAQIGILASNDQDWTASFGDIDNDGDFDVFMTKHDKAQEWYTNNGNGTFSATASGSFTYPNNTAIQSLYEDFDNDGFVDLLFTGMGVQQRLYRNNGNGTFTQVPNATLGFGSNNFASFATGDLNHDGKIDIYASYHTSYNTPSSSIVDRLWLNSTSNSNNFLTLNLKGTTSNKEGIGARAYIYGAWGVQTREVRSSESYGTLNSYSLHFGLGTATQVDSIVVRWPSGQKSKIVCPVSANQFVNIVEGTPTCFLACSSINITPSGSTTICPGDVLTLSAPTGAYTYLWSNGATTQSIDVNTAGTYNVIVSSGAGCSATAPSIVVTMNPPENPVITAQGDLEFCPGGSVVLEAAGGSPVWNTGETTSTITATQDGEYYFYIQGLCQPWYSDTLVVTLFDNTPPSASGTTITSPQSVTLNATGTNVSWWDAPSGGNLLGTGNTFVTPVLSSTTTYYVQDDHQYNGSIGNVGSTDIASAGYSTGTINGYLIFDVLTNCRLNSVEVSTDSVGTRVIELRDASGAVLQALSVNIPAGTSTVDLGFDLTPGTYQLGTNTAQNNSEFGANSPFLKRNQSGASYPYVLTDVLSITGGHTGTAPTSAAYYYFYNWEVEVLPIVCPSDRTPVTVTYVNTSGIDNEEASQFLIYPNPATNWVNVEFNVSETAPAQLEVTDMTGRKVVLIDLGTVHGKVTRILQTDGFAQGVYNVTLTVGEKTYHTLVVIK